MLFPYFLIKRITKLITAICKQYFRYYALFMFSLFLVVNISPVFSQIPSGNRIKSSLENPRTIVQKGEEAYQNQQLFTAHKYFKKAAEIFAQQGDKENQAITLTNLGRLQFELGKNEDALNSWKTAQEVYSLLGQKNEVTRSQIYQAHALQKLGYFPRACGTLLQALDISKPKSCEKLTVEYIEQFVQQKNLQEPDVNLLNAWRSLGDVLRVIGKLEESSSLLEKIAAIGSNSHQAATLLSLGNTYKNMGDLQVSREKKVQNEYSNIPWLCKRNDRSISFTPMESYQEAEEKYKAAKDKVPGTAIGIKTQINLLNLLLQREQLENTNIQKKGSELLDKAKILLSQIDISSLPTSQNKIYAQINLAKSSACLQQLRNQQPEWQTIIKQLKTAEQEAKQIKDRLSQSYILGSLGSLYEYRAWKLENNKSNNQAQDFIKKARSLTEKALYIAQIIQKPEITYNWEWQLGRLLEKQGEKKKAIAAYQEAIKTLESARYQLIRIDADVRLSFLENIEPVYQRLLELLLQNPTNDSQFLLGVTKISESLQLAELENLLRCRFDNSIGVEINQIEKSKAPAAIIHPIILRDRVEVIVQLPNADKSSEKVRRYTTRVNQEEVEDTISQLQKRLKNYRIGESNKSILPLAQKLYDWLIKPAIANPEFPKKGTLVFIVDSTLQGIPFAVLHNGNQYLVEKYSLAVNLVSKLPNPQPLKLNQSHVLLAGISKKAPSFSNNLQPLSHVEKELDGIQKIISHQRLNNQQFTKENFEKEINANPFQILHIATHGEFSSNREETFIYAWYNKINLELLETILKTREESDSQPIELLVLSACETATGDRRAALGIAGVALKANTRSTLASLWNVNDESTSKFMQQFYKNLEQQNMNKAEALRQVQISFLKDPDSVENHPYYWSAFILAGNWL
ncbi:MAG: CHAT domain-containing protein [Nostocaceae cyanobacterium]|nr:CHAT domain-containing protein [Nostocaceae cyanobacterium]